MPTFVPDEIACGNRYSSWYDGEMPTEVNQQSRGEISQRFKKKKEKEKEKDVTL